MRARPTEMTENVRVRAARLFQSIGEDREPTVVQCTSRQVSLLVGGLGEADDGAVAPGEDDGRDGDGAEGVAEDATEETGLLAPLFHALLGTGGG
jgi:hypothetical protein